MKFLEHTYKNDEKEIRFMAVNVLLQNKVKKKLISEEQYYQKLDKLKEWVKYRDFLRDNNLL